MCIRDRDADHAREHDRVRIARRQRKIVRQDVGKVGLCLFLSLIHIYFAFLGQFAETPRDTIFTTEYSMRTGMEAVYTLLRCV